VNRESDTCPVCGTTSSIPIYAGLSKCRSCTHVWADLALDWEALRAIYHRSYFFGEEYSNYLLDRRTIERNFAARLRVLRRFMTPVHGRLLEVGCAYGLFLNTARDLFASVEGIDISEDAVAHARSEFSVRATAGDFLRADLSASHYDVVCMWDTIEHLAEPRAYLERAASLMPPGSILAFTTGDIGSLTARVQRDRWRLIHPPSHLQYFTRASATQLVERCGYRVRHLEHCGFWRSAASMVHNLVGLRWGRPALAQRLAAALPPQLDIYLNLGDILFVIAERR
jgi:2-polyprenyl-3-methyl-5-hydroxy-6-metoxy-1,4-benzoquinol methylase